MTDQVSRFIASLDDPEEPKLTVSVRSLRNATPEVAKRFADHLRERADQLERDYAYLQQRKHDTI